MNHGIRTFRVCFFLLLFSFAGCATRESVAPHANLEQYREVYLLKSKTDPRHVVDRIAEGLRRAGFDVKEVPCDDMTKNGHSEAVKNARALAVTDGDHPAVICSVGSLILYTEPEITISRQYGFERLEIGFYDIKSGKLVFKTAKYNYDDTVPENIELNRRFAKISDAFFPGKPNPFLTR